jgi:hypothetical protein
MQDQPACVRTPELFGKMEEYKRGPIDEISEAK